MRLVVYAAIILASGAAGFAWAKLVGCSTGGCPLTATPWRGAVFGMVFGVLGVLTMLPRAGTAVADGAAESDAIRHPKDAAEFAAMTRPEGGRTVLVDFYADWCGPCQRLAPELARFAEANRGTVDVVKVNVDTHADIAREYGVTSIPAVYLFRAGEVTKQTVGAMNSAEIAAWVAEGKG